jgi:nitric oxide reductase subunit B
MNMWSFWIMVGGMCFMTFTLTFAGVVQTHMQRVLGEDFMTVQNQLDIFFIMRLGSGTAVALGVVLFLIAIFGPAREQLPAHVKGGNGNGSSQ